MFQSLTEVDSQGRVIRRPQTLADLVSVMAPDDAPAQRPAVDAAVRGVVLHFADPACSFLRAPQADELVDGSIIDIGHEALIRRWERLGGLDQQSWVRQEQSDAESYRTLLLYTQDAAWCRGASSGRSRRGGPRAGPRGSGRSATPGAGRTGLPPRPRGWRAAVPR